MILIVLEWFLLNICVDRVGVSVVVLVSVLKWWWVMLIFDMFFFFLDIGFWIFF